MQPMLLKSRVAAAPAGLGGCCGTGRHARRSQRQQHFGRGLVPLFVAAVEEPETEEVEAEFDKEDAYRRFEALLEENSVSFANGDKVRWWRCSLHAWLSYKLDTINPKLLA